MGGVAGKITRTSIRIRKEKKIHRYGLLTKTKKVQNPYTLEINKFYLAAKHKSNKKRPLHI